MENNKQVQWLMFALLFGTCVCAGAITLKAPGIIGVTGGIIKYTVASGTPNVTNGLVAWWKFDENTGSTASDSFGTNSAAISGATWTAAQVGVSALWFDGTNDEIVLDGNSNFSAYPSNCFTISAWMYPNGSNMSDVVFSRGWCFSSSDYTVYYVGTYNVSAGQMKTQVSDGTNLITAISSGNTVLANMWQHYVVTFNGTSLVVYRNGVEMARATNSAFGVVWNGTSASFRKTSIGSDAAGDSSFFSGALDDVRFYNRGLLSNECVTLFNFR